MRPFLCSLVNKSLAFLHSYCPKSMLDERFIKKLLGIVAVSAAFSFTIRRFRHARIKSSSKKAILITGCDTGFGHLLAKRMESEGFTVFACCLNATSEDSRQLNTDTGLMHVLQMNVTDEDQIRSCVDTVKETLRKEGKQLWAVVNNAGIGEIGFIEMLPIATYQRAFDVNTLGTVRVSKAFIPFLRGHGRVINITSLTSRFSFHFFSPYAMSKHATLAFSDCLRREVEPFNVKVVTIEPGLYGTNLVETSKLSGMMERMWNSADEEVREQYGMDFVNACEKRIRTRLTRDPRTNFNEVIEKIAEVIWTVKPDFHYIPHAPTSLRIKLTRLLPEYILDRKMKKAWYPRDVEPAFVCQSTS